MSTTLLLGGARSGKSGFAVELARRHNGDVTYLATAEPIDDDMAARIQQHRVERPDWPTIEEPIDVADALATVPPTTLVVIDCLTVWLGNLYAKGLDALTRLAAADELSAACAGRPGPTIVISNEVGMGIHPETEIGRHYRDELGRVNQRFAAAADLTLLMVAGRAIALHDPWELL